jgi:hypothetical protein
LSKEQLFPIHKVTEAPQLVYRFAVFLVVGLLFAFLRHGWSDAVVCTWLVVVVMLLSPLFLFFSFFLLLILRVAFLFTAIAVVTRIASQEMRLLALMRAI